MTVRDEIHGLIDALPEDELPAVGRFLRSVAPEREDALGEFLAAAPEDDESSTPDQEAAAEVAREALRRGERATIEEVRRKLLS